MWKHWLNYQTFWPIFITLVLLYTAQFQFTGHSLDLSDNVLLFPHHYNYNYIYIIYIYICWSNWTRSIFENEVKIVCFFSSEVELWLMNMQYQLKIIYWGMWAWTCHHLGNDRENSICKFIFITCTMYIRI